MRTLTIALLFTAATAQAQSSQLQTGITLLDQNKRAEARAVLVPYAKANPKDAKGAFAVGRLLVEEGEALLNTGKTDEGVKKFEEATDWLEKAVDLDPKNGSYHRWLGDAYGRRAQRANKLRQAMLAGKVKDQYELAVKLDPTDIEARESVIEFYLQAPGFMGGSTEKAENEAREIIKLNKLRGHFTLANVLSRQKKFDQAMAELKTAEREFPDSIEPALRVATFNVQLKKFDEAFVLLDNVLKRFPGDRRATFQIGRTAALSGLQLDRGEQALRSYLAGPAPDRRMPQFASAHFRLGMILERKGNTAGARAEYSEALRLNPELKDARTAVDKLPKA